MRLNLPGEGRYVLAFSGGSDSVALLDAMLQQGLRIRCVHVVHGNSPADSGGEAILAFCQQVCAEAGVNLAVRHIRLDDYDRTIGVEAHARNLRYKVLQEAVEPGEELVTAHHADDQFETILFRLFRGMGVEGGKGILPLSLEGPVPVRRPLLPYDKEAILNYIAQRNLRFFDDPNNRNTAFSRAWLRHRLMPLVKEHFGGKAVKGVGRFRNNMAETAELLREIYLEDKLSLLKKDGRVPVPGLMALSSSRRRNFVRYWCKEATGNFPGATFLAETEKRCLCKGKREATRFEVEGIEAFFDGEFLWFRQA